MSTLHVVLLPYEGDASRRVGPERVRAQSARAREALRISAESTGAQIVALEKDANDAPLPSNGWHWSISHGRGFAAGAVARQPLGVDVERIEPRNQDVVSRVTSRDELELLGGFRWDAFMRVWTAKEAVLKKAGCGLQELSACVLVACIDDETMIVAHRGRDHLVRQRTRAQHVASVSHDGPSDLEIAWSWRGEFSDELGAKGDA